MTGAQLELDAGFQDGSRSWLSHTKEVNPHANLDGCAWEPVHILAHIPMAWLLIALSVPNLIVRPLAGFQMAAGGRFWVATEAFAAVSVL